MKRTEAARHTAVTNADGRNITVAKDRNNETGELGTAGTALQHNSFQEELMAFVDYAEDNGLVDAQNNPIVAVELDFDDPLSYKTVFRTVEAMINEKTNTGNSQLSAESGYHRVSGGVIHQWKDFNIGDIVSEQDYTIDFPVQFPNECLTFVANLISNQTDANGANRQIGAVVSPVSATKKSAVVRLREVAADAQDMSVRIFAIGR